MEPADRAERLRKVGAGFGSDELDRGEVTWTPPNSPLSFFANGRAGFDLNRAESDVLHRLNIGNGFFDDVQRISLKDDKTTPLFRFEAGVQAPVGLGQLRFSAFAEHGAYAPNVVIPGGLDGQPFIDGERETNFGGKFQYRYEFPVRFVRCVLASRAPDADLLDYHGLGSGP